MSLRLVAISVLLVACSDAGKTPGQDHSPDASVGGASADAAPRPDANTTDAAPPALPDGGLGLACTVDEITPIVTCAAQMCLSQAGDQTALISCLTLQCGTTLLGLSPSCLQCVLTGFTLDPAALASACVSGATPP